LLLFRTPCVLAERLFELDNYIQRLATEKPKYGLPERDRA
jgi:hypothetical protein